MDDSDWGGRLLWSYFDPRRARCVDVRLRRIVTSKLFVAAVNAIFIGQAQGYLLNCADQALSSAAGLGNKEACRFFALYELAKDPEAKFAECYLRASAEMGSVEGMLDYSLFLLRGRNEHCDVECALEWLQVAAAAGSARAMSQLAAMTLNRQKQAASTEIVQAIANLRRASRKGDSVAAAGLAVCYQHGVGVRCSPQLASFWRRRSRVRSRGQRSDTATPGGNHHTFISEHRLPTMEELEIEARKLRAPAGVVLIGAPHLALNKKKQRLAMSLRSSVEELLQRRSIDDFALLYHSIWIMESAAGLGDRTARSFVKSEQFKRWCELRLSGGLDDDAKT